MTLALAVVAAVAVAAPPGKLKCFNGAPATCSVSQNTVTLDTSSGGFAGAFITNSKQVSGTSLGGVTFSFQYDCDPSDTKTACVGGGSPRWSIPIDKTGDGKTDGFAFLDAAGCGSTGTVSTASSSCAVNFDSISYANWAAFASTNPSYTIGNSLPFVITDTTEPGTTLIFAITITRP
jgi:hypothetical protein